MSEGYGADWTEWDAFIEAKFPRPKDARYQNWQPFLSPKRQWMAFYSTNYGDIRIVKLPSTEVVCDRFYSNFDEKVYASHTNHSTYVPSYLDMVLTPADGTRWTLLDGEPDGDDGTTFAGYAEKDGSVLKSLPFAFNAWTIWAADYEFYVDILDLRQVDDGIVSLSGAKSFEIPIGASHVRNYVKTEVSHWYNMDEKKWCDDVTTSFKYLTETATDRFDPGKSHFYNMYDDADDKPGYSPVDELPWQALQRRIKEREAKKVASA